MTEIVRLGANYSVYLGFWTNWSYGRIHGATLTLTRQDGGLLIAFIALFIAFVGRKTWRIACFISHYILSSNGPKDALHHQRQVILRNSEAAVEGIQKLCYCLFVWKTAHQANVYLRLLPWIMLALANVGAFHVAGIFSSRIATTSSSEVLISSTCCGFLSDNGTQSIYNSYSWRSQRYSNNMNYAQHCYVETPDPQSCNLYVKPKIKSTVFRNASCPFRGGICKTDSGNIMLDTGPLDSQLDLGINTPSENRFTYRRIHHCAPLKTEGYSATYNFPAGDSSSPTLPPVMRYYYGGVTNSMVGNHTFTYQYELNTSHPIPYPGSTSASSAYTDYSLGAITVYRSKFNRTKAEQASQFVPISQLERQDADTYLLFLSANNLQYSEPSDDLWYPAHQVGTYLYVVSTKGIYEYSTYRQDYPATVLACLDQEQVCNPNLPASSACEPLRATWDIPLSKIPDLWQTEEQKRAVSWSLRGLKRGQGMIGEMVSSLKTSVLPVRYRVKGAIQQSFPSNQWQLDVELWHNTIVAGIQNIFVDVARGLPDEYAPYRFPPDSPEAHKLCSNQKILSTSYTSFSVLGLIITFTVGVLIISMDHLSEPSVDFIQKRRDLCSYQRLEWCTNETLQIQRLAHEQLGYGGSWSRANKSNPITEKDATMAILNISNSKHPVLVWPSGLEIRPGPNLESGEDSMTQISESSLIESSV